MEDYAVIIVLAALFIALVMLFAQIRLFSIDSTLKEILAELRRERRPEIPIDLADVENPTSMLKL
jgi:hypothetical protein